MIENLKWVDTDKTTIEATIDGQKVFVPTDHKNRHYAEIVRLNLTIADPD